MKTSFTCCLLLILAIASLVFAAADATETLIDAAICGDINHVRSLLAGGADLNSKRYGLTALIAAASKGHTDIVKALLKSKANVNAEGTDGETALWWSAFFGHTDIVKALLESKADVNAEDTDGVTALWVAAQKGHTETVRTLLESKADVNTKRKTDGVTALGVAAAQGHTDIVKALLEKKADVNAKGTDGWTALLIASQKGHIESVEALLESKADVNAITSGGWTAYTLADHEDFMDIKRILVKAGAKELSAPTVKAAFSFPVPLNTSFFRTKARRPSIKFKPDYTKYDTIVHINDTSKLKVSYEKTREESSLPHYYALSTGIDPVTGLSRSLSFITEKSVFQTGGRGIMVHHCGRPGTRITFGGHKYSPFSPVPGLELWQGAIDIDPVYGLVVCPGTKPNVPSEVIALLEASQQNDIAGVKLLFDQNADVNATDNLGWTPLHVASAEGHLEMVRLLLSKGADANTRNFGGDTPVRLAIENGHTEITELLKEYGALSKGADVNAKYNTQSSLTNFEENSRYTVVVLETTAKIHHTRISNYLAKIGFKVMKTYSLAEVPESTTIVYSTEEDTREIAYQLEQLLADLGVSGPINMQPQQIGKQLFLWRHIGIFLANKQKLRVPPHPYPEAIYHERIGRQND